MNKKANNTMWNFIIMLIVAIVGFFFLLQILSGVFENAEDFSEGGYLCLASLKMEDYFTIGGGDKSTAQAKVELFQSRCSTINDESEITRDHVAKPRNETNMQNALSKKIADRMGYVWWMTGQGSLEQLLESKDAQLTLFDSQLNGKGDSFPCITFMNFKVEPSDYYPKNYNYFHLLNYMKNTDYSIEQKGGEKYRVSYYDYITSFSSEGNGGLFITPGTGFKPNEIYSIAVMQPPKDAGWLDQFYDCGESMAYIGVGTYFGGPIGALVGTLAAGFTSFNGGGLYACANSFIKEEFGQDQHGQDVQTFNSFQSGTLYHEMNLDKFKDKFFMIIGPKDKLDKFCVQVKSGEQQ